MKQPNKNDYFIGVDGTEILSYDKAYKAYKEYADDLEDYINHLNQAKNEGLDLVSCLYSAEKIEEAYDDGHYDGQIQRSKTFDIETYR